MLHSHWRIRSLHAQNHIELQDYHLWGPTTVNPSSESGSILITDRSPYWFGLKRLSMALRWPSGLREHIDMTAVICWLTMYSSWMCASIRNTETGWMNKSDVKVNVKLLWSIWLWFSSRFSPWEEGDASLAQLGENAGRTWKKKLVGPSVCVCVCLLIQNETHRISWG